MYWDYNKTTIMRYYNIALVLILTVCGLCMQSCNVTQAQNNKQQKHNGEQLHVSFNFNRGGIASSQYAVWIEDAKGSLVRTLYATSFTAKGGYQFRKESLPTWVSKSQLGKMPAAEVDAITGATPQSGRLTYTWDGTDQQGRTMPEGTYSLVIEGSTYWESRVIYKGIISWRENNTEKIEINEQWFSPSATNKDMINEVEARIEK